MQGNGSKKKPGNYITAKKKVAPIGEGTEKVPGLDY